ncbi:DUF3108 domain-containing protein [Shewanella sp. 202IG2-18]|uniref:DUF3108 domain-containing protein n=1 Tax=Parashewanella hymeniacidonis TaxID=2807618 RepID=UPI0019615534|nr:DUF3108 domain-containing protein [Parashewanella hymeniacidonis]MBM7074089.1 DUF3108 domain-containing protein [Parashewanella hymeniacidonis]
MIKQTLKAIIITSFFTFPLFTHAETFSPLTPQRAEYKVYYGDIELGKARYNLEPTGKNEYRYTFESALALLVLSDNREVSSEFSVENNTIKPLRYFHDRKGTGSDYQEQLVFLDQQKKIFSRYKGDKKEFEYHPELYDSLSIQLQLRLDVANHKKSYKYELIKSNKKDDYTFKIDGEEVIEINGIKYDTVKLEVVRKKKKRQTYIWMAPKLAYLPVKLSHLKKGKKQLEIYINSYSFSGSDKFPELK